jgi:hypothetical protein
VIREKVKESKKWERKEGAVKATFSQALKT